MDGWRAFSTVLALASAALCARLQAGAPLSADAVPSVVFEGEVRAGESFEKSFGGRFLFRLEPDALGWTITVREEGRDEDLSRLTPPFHFVPNPRDIEGWHFRNADNTGPNEAGEKNVNAPGKVREFVFSPEVGRTIQAPGTSRPVTPEDVERVRAYGRGRLTILSFGLENLQTGQRARFGWMRFRVELWWEGSAAAAPPPPAPSPETPRGPSEARSVFIASPECRALLLARRGQIEESLRACAFRILNVLLSVPAGPRGRPMPWTEEMRRQAAEPGFDGYSLELWAGPGPGPAPGGGALSIRCNVLCPGQVSLATVAPSLCLPWPGEEFRTEWHVRTGSDSMDRAILEALPSCLQDSSGDR